MTTFTQALRSTFGFTARSTNTAAADLAASMPAWTGKLQEGSTDVRVRYVQQAMNLWLSSKGQPALTVDGRFGPKLTAAVKEFQREQGAMADGIVGPRTVELFKQWAGVDRPPAVDPLRPVEPSQPGRIPQLKSGDVVLQRSQSGLSDAIANASNSNFSHVGVVEMVNGRPYVIEAVQPVRRIPFEQWKAQGRGGKIEVRRMPGLSDDAARRIVAKANTFVGRPYDIRYRWDDDKIYCSELVMKAYAAAGLTVGKVESLGSLNLTAADKARARQLGVSLSETLITPDSLAKDSRLTTLYSDFFN